MELSASRFIRTSFTLTAALLLCTHSPRLGAEPAATPTDDDESMTKAEAAADKDAAIRQITALYPDEDTEIETVGYSKLAGEHTWLNRTRRTVGMVQAETMEHSFYKSSAVLLDKDGTLVMCAHQFMSRAKHFDIYFYVNNRAAPIKVPVKTEYIDEKHDVMFASIPASFVRKHHLRPVTWSNISFSEPGQFMQRTVISVGWPGQISRRHAEQGTIYRADPTHDLAASKSTAYCKIISSGTGFGGMSGGGIFNEQKFVGIFNATSVVPGLSMRTIMTPADFLYEHYKNLYPQRAAHAGFKAEPFRPFAPECAYNAQDMHPAH